MAGWKTRLPFQEGLFQEDKGYFSGLIFLLTGWQ
jgi:hypothetical protein